MTRIGFDMIFFPNKLLLNLLACGMILSCSLYGAPAAQNGSSSTQTKKGNGQTSVQKGKKQSQDWQKFVSKENGFSVDFPSLPEHIQQTIDIPKTDLKISYETYISEPSDSVVYVVSVWNYPAEIDMSKPEVNLQDGFGGMLSALPGSEVLNMRMTQVQGFKALEFLVKNEDIYFQGKLILVHNTLYQVFTVYKSSEDMTQNYIRFIDSFKLLEPEKRAIRKNGNGKNGSSQKMNV